jgi:formylglycine-generating enzyme required for sulfatase activity
MTESVTNAQYKRFKPSHTYEAGHGNKPVAKVTYGEAMAYAAWLSRETGKRFRLPTEDERKSAEESFEADYSDHPLDECPDVGTFGKNADGVTGLKGTVFDWCLHPDDMTKARSGWTPEASPPLPDAARIQRAVRILAILDAMDKA